MMREIKERAKKERNIVTEWRKKRVKEKQMMWEIKERNKE